MTNPQDSTPLTGALLGRRVILGVSGSIAAYKSVDLTRLLVKAGAEVQVIMTPGAERFVAPLTFGTVSRRPVLTTIFEETDTEAWTKHVDLGIWADLLVVAPASANTLARMAGGFCETMLEAVFLSARCPVVVAPAMDHDMYAHPAVGQNLDRLRAHGVSVIDAAHGELASGLIGDGRLPEPDELFHEIADRLTASQGAFAGKRALVTAGPTREAIDPVRFLSNGSTGTMGFALAEALVRRGAEVHLVTGPTDLRTPTGVHRHDVVTADEMLEAALPFADADIVIAAAAVSDYAPAEPSPKKQKKRDDGTDLTLALRRTPDILATIGKQRHANQIIIGFALETNNLDGGDDPETSARSKLAAKNLDFVVVNLADEAGSGFGRGTNRAVMIGADGSRREFARTGKKELADQLLTAVI